jgi:hypothetical protein
MAKRIFVALLCCLSFCGLALPSDMVDASTESGWGIPVLIENYHEGGGYYPEIAVDGDGNAFAVWNHWYGAGNSVMANRYVAGYGWMTAEIIDEGWGNTGVPKVTTDGAGNAFAAWQQFDGVRTSILACRYVQGEGWNAPELIETDDAFNAFSPDIVADQDGNAVAVWVQGDGTAQSVFANRYTEGVGWGTRVVIESESLGDANLPDLAGDGSGTFTAVWMQDDGVRNNVWANRYTFETGWVTAQLVEANDFGLMSPSIAMDASGNAMATWYQYDGSLYNIWANRYVTGTGWGTPELVEEDDGGNAETPVVGVDSAGNAIVVWRQWEGSRANALANRYVVGTGWGEPELLESDDTENARDLRVAVNADGVAFALWNQYDSVRYNVWSARYVLDTGWEAAVLVENSGGSCTPAAIGVDDGGNAIAVWGQVDYDFESMFANRFVVADTTPPTLVVTSPLTGATVTEPSVTVSGETEPGADLYIGGLLAQVDEDTGEFAAVVALVEGPNDIVITASDSAGNSATMTVAVTYEVPDVNLTALQDEIALLQEENAALLEQLDDVTDRLDAAEEELDQAESDIGGMPTSSLVFGAIAAVAAILFVAMLAMYIGLRKQMRGAGGVPEEPEPPSTE